MMFDRKYDVVLVPCEEGGYTAYVPALRGCWSEGETEEETLQNLPDAIREYLEAIADAYRDKLHRVVTV